MRAVDVYLMYCALKAHFKGDYDYHKFSGQTKIKRESFFKRKDRIFFVKVGRKYEDGEILDYFVANFIQNRNGYILNFNEKNYEDWLQRKKMFYQIFSQELEPHIKNFNPLFESKSGQHPTLLKEYLGKRISLETMIILDELVEFSETWDKDLSWDDFVWPDVKKLMNNYKGFLTINPNKYRMKLLTLIEDTNNEK
tara:strand:- start:69 stop:656 length:588 start_codon:yes stop_codon:yes gene_type:complete